MSLFLHLANKKPQAVLQSPTIQPQFASGPMHGSNNERGEGQQSNFRDVRRVVRPHQHKEDTLNLKHDVERLVLIKDGDSRSRRMDIASPNKVGANSMAEERVRSSQKHVDGHSRMVGCHDVIAPKDPSNSIEQFSSSMKQSEFSGFVEPDSRKRPIASQGSSRGAQSIRIRFTSEA
jgi:hypothetical protein